MSLYIDLKGEPYPTEDPENVDIRREKTGLGLLSVYFRERFDIVWKVGQNQKGSGQLKKQALFPE